MPRCLFRPFIVISVLILYFSLFAYDLTKSLDNGVTMTPKRRAINLSWFFILLLLLFYSVRLQVTNTATYVTYSTICEQKYIDNIVYT